MLHAPCFPALRGRDLAIEQEVRPPGDPPLTPQPPPAPCFPAAVCPGRAADPLLAASRRFPPSFTVQGVGSGSGVGGKAVLGSSLLLLLPSLPLVPGGFASALGRGLGQLGGVSEGGGGSVLGSSRQAGRMLTLVPLVARGVVGQAVVLKKLVALGIESSAAARSREDIPG